MYFVRSFVLILTRNNESELSAPVRAKLGLSLSHTHTTRQTLARTRAAVDASHAQVRKSTKAVISEGGGEGSLTGRDAALCGVESTRNHQVHSAR